MPDRVGWTYRPRSFLCSHLIQILQHRVLWGHLKQSGVGFSCPSSLAAVLRPTAPPERSSLAAGVDAGREGCHSVAGKPAQKSCSGLTKLAQFP